MNINGENGEGAIQPILFASIERDCNAVTVSRIMGSIMTGTIVVSIVSCKYQYILKTLYLDFEIE